MGLLPASSTAFPLDRTPVPGVRFARPGRWLTVSRAKACFTGAFERLFAILPLNRQQLHLKHQGSVWPDVGARATRPVAKFRRNEKLPLRSRRHELQRFCPPLDDSTHREGRRLASLVGAVEFR